MCIRDSIYRDGEQFAELVDIDILRCENRLLNVLTRACVVVVKRGDINLRPQQSGHGWQANQQKETKRTLESKVSHGINLRGYRVKTKYQIKGGEFRRASTFAQSTDC